MSYATATRRLRRSPTLGYAGFAGRGFGRLGQDDGNGFDWSNFATSVASSAAGAAAGAGVNLLKSVGAPKPITAVPVATSTTSPFGTTTAIPSYVWVLGGLGFMMILILMMRR